MSSQRESHGLPKTPLAPLVHSACRYFTRIIICCTLMLKIVFGSFPTINWSDVCEVGSGGGGQEWEEEVCAPSGWHYLCKERPETRQVASTT